MPRRVTVLGLAAALSAAALPAAAQAADTFTVDGASADAGCTAAKLCKTLTAAVAAVADGDTIVVRPGTYDEPGRISLTKPNVTIQGTAGRTIVNGGAAAVGDPVFTLIEGDVLDGITVGAPAGAGPGVLVTGRGTTVRNGAILRLAAGTQDQPAYRVDPTVAAGTSTIAAVTILNGPAGSTGQSAPAVLGNGSSSLAIRDSVIISGAGNGPAVGIVGSDNTGADPVPSTIVRSSLIATNPAADALTVTGTATSGTRKAVALDTAVLLPGSAAAGLRVATTAGGLPGQDTPGDITLTATHVTVTGGRLPFAVSAAAGGQTPVGNIELSVDRSILRGTDQGTVASFVPATPIVLLSGAANSARVAITTTDTNQSAFSSPSGGATVTVTGTSDTALERLFVNPAKLNLHLRADAPVLDKGGPAVASESSTDVDGQPRQTGAATDLGADEFLNRPPVASATATPARARQDQAVSFDAGASTDPEAGAGGAISSYRWSFGDGTSAETATPTTTHAYTRLGLYNATLTVVDNFGLASAAVPIPTIAVGDGSAPVVKVSSPTRNGAFAIFATTRLGRAARKVLDPVLVGKVTFSGTATDTSGIRLVQLSIRRLAVGNAKVPARPKACTYLDGKTRFRVTACTKPVFFTVRQRGGAFTYRLKKSLRPKAGRYQLSVRATDGAGVVSAPVLVPFRLR